MPIKLKPPYRKPQPTASKPKTLPKPAYICPIIIFVVIVVAQGIICR